MGGGASKKKDYKRTQGDDPGFDAVCEAMGVDEKAVVKFFDLFKKADTSSDGSVSVGEFLAHVGVTNSKECQLMRRAFHIIDEVDGDAERKLEFITFFVALHNFCVLGKTEMLRFAFKMFDRDQSGEVTRDELRQMMIMVHGQNAKTDSQVDELLKKIDFSKDGAIACFEFEQKSGLLNNLLMPVFQSQQKLREACIGQSYWAKCEKAKEKYAVAHLAPEFDGNLVHLYFKATADARQGRATKAVKADAAATAMQVKADAERVTAERQAAERAEEVAFGSERAASDTAAAAARQAAVAAAQAEVAAGIAAEHGGPAAAAYGGATDGWVKYDDPSTGHPYWYNEATGLSSWADPATCGW